MPCCLLNVHCLAAFTELSSRDRDHLVGYTANSGALVHPSPPQRTPRPSEDLLNVPWAPKRNPLELCVSSSEPSKPGHFPEKEQNGAWHFWGCQAPRGHSAPWHLTPDRKSISSSAQTCHPCPHGLDVGASRVQPLHRLLPHKTQARGWAATMLSWKAGVMRGYLRQNGGAKGGPWGPSAL